MGFDSERQEQEVAAVLVDHLWGEIVMGGFDWIWEGEGFDDGAVLEIKVVELGFEGLDSAVYVRFCGYEGLELVQDLRGFVTKEKGEKI